MTAFAAAVNTGEAVEETSNSSVVSPRIQARGRRTNGSTSVQPVKTPEEERPPPNIFFPSLDTARCPELLRRQSQSTPKTKRSKLQPESSSEDDDSDSNNSYQADSFLEMSNESSSSGSFKTDDCEESESESFEESEEESDGEFLDDYKEEDYDSSDEDDDDEEEPYVPPKRSSRKRKITPTKPFAYAKRKKVSAKKQKTIQDCAPYACTSEKDAIAFLPTAAEATNSTNNTDDSDAHGSSA